MVYWAFLQSLKMTKANPDQTIKTENFFSSQAWRVFVIEAFLFCLTLGIGIATAFKISKILELREIEVPKVSFWDFIFSFTLATLFIFLIIWLVRIKKQKGIIFRILFILTVFWGGALLLSAWIPDIPSLFLMGVLIFWWWRRPSVLVQDLCVVLGIAGVGSVLGLTFTPEMVVVFLIVFSIYDFIAVYKTKHMIKMAKEMIESKAILGLVIPANISDFTETLKEVKPGGKFLVLGGGDIVFPLLFCSSLIPYGVLDSLIVAFFSLIGLLASFLFFMSQKKRRPIPALPPIALFSIIGYLITRIL